MSDIIKIVLVLENSNILSKGVTKSVTNETREQRWGFLGTLVRTLGSILLGNLLSGKGIVRAGSANKKEKELEELVMEKNGIFETTSSFNKLLNSKVLPKQALFNWVFSWDNLPKKIKDGAYVINLDEYADVGLLYFVKRLKLFLSIVLALNMFLKKLKNLSNIKTSKLTFFE